MPITILGHKLKDLPWEERPKDYLEPVWRYSKNPIITRETVRGANSIFNSAVVAYKDEFRGVFRIDTKELVMELHSGEAKTDCRGTLIRRESNLMPKTRKSADSFTDTIPESYFWKTDTT